MRKKINDIANEIFWYFEENIFENCGSYPRNTNLIFAFADYMDAMSDDEITQYLKLCDSKDVACFRQIIKDGINAWLKYNVKTMILQ